MAAFISSTALNINNGRLTVAWSAPATQDVTAMAWINLTGATTGTYRNMVTGEPNNIAMQTFTDGITFDAGTGQADHTGSALTTNTWYHIAETIANNGSATNHHVRGYINGALNVDAIDTTTFAAWTGITIGNYQTAIGGVANSLPLNGQIGDVRFWTRALTTIEIVQEMKSKVPVNREGLLFWVPLDDNLFADRSGHGFIFANAGTLSLQNGIPINTWVAKAPGFWR